MEEVSIGSLEVEEQHKLYSACKQLLFIRETEYDVILEDLNAKDREIQELQSATSQTPQHYSANLHEMEQLRSELRQQEADHETEIQTLRREFQNQIDAISRQKSALEREKNDALRELESSVRAQSANEAGREEFLMLNDKLKQKRDVSHMRIHLASSYCLVKLVFCRN